MQYPAGGKLIKTNKNEYKFMILALFSFFFSKQQTLQMNANWSDAIYNYDDVDDIYKY